MLLLANEIIDANKITVIVLCIAALVFVLLDAVLVVLLHKDNKRFARRRQLRIMRERTEASANAENKSEDENNA